MTYTTYCPECVISAETMEMCECGIDYGPKRIPEPEPEPPEPKYVKCKCSPCEHMISWDGVDNLCFACNNGCCDHCGCLS